MELIHFSETSTDFHWTMWRTSHKTELFISFSIYFLLTTYIKIIFAMITRVSQKVSTIKFLLYNTIKMSVYNRIIFLHDPPSTGSHRPTEKKCFWLSAWPHMPSSSLGKWQPRKASLSGSKRWQKVTDYDYTHNASTPQSSVAVGFQWCRWQRADRHYHRTLWHILTTVSASPEKC